MSNQKSKINLLIKKTQESNPNKALSLEEDSNFPPQKIEIFNHKRLSLFSRPNANLIFEELQEDASGTVDISEKK